MINQEENTHSDSWSLAEIQQLRSSHGRGRKRWGAQDSGASRNGPLAINQSSESPFHTRAESTDTPEEKQAARERRNGDRTDQPSWLLLQFKTATGLLSPGVESSPSTEIYSVLVVRINNCDKILVCRCTWNFHIAMSS
jgi:hypothetical protein